MQLLAVVGIVQEDAWGGLNQLGGEHFPYSLPSGSVRSFAGAPRCRSRSGCQRPLPDPIVGASISAFGVGRRSAPDERQIMAAIACRGRESSTNGKSTSKSCQQCPRARCFAVGSSGGSH